MTLFSFWPMQTALIVEMFLPTETLNTSTMMAIALKVTLSCFALEKIQGVGTQNEKEGFASNAFLLGGLV
jgi:hypothetical protein